jgi:amidohydrolase
VEEMKQRLLAKADQYLPEVIQFRRHIHAHPELSFQETETSRFVSEQLTKIGIVQQKKCAGTGIVALIEGRNPTKKCIALRADMDALPILEENDIPYKSLNTGVMHACGHDVHTSCLLGTAKILFDIRNEFEGTVKLIFQPGEEKHPGGAGIMIQEGVLHDPAPEAIFALHVYPNLPCGTVGFRSNQYMASADEIYITIHGKGGHAAQPHNTVDPIAVAAQLIVALQQVISRKCNPISPSVLTFGKIQGGFAPNVIPDTVELMGTFRAMDEQWRYEAHRWIKEITQQTCAMYGASATVDIPVGYPSLFNDPELTDRAQKWAADLLGPDNVRPLEKRMGAEDFSFYSQRIPGCFFRIGTNIDNQKLTAPVHNSRFNIDENAMKYGMATMSWLALNELAAGQ